MFQPEQIQLNALQSVLQSTIRQQIRDGYQQDITAQTIIDSLKQNIGIPPYKLKDHLLFHHEQLYVPNIDDLKLQILQKYHDSPTSGHFGQLKTFELINREYFWPGLRKFINRFIKSCDTCHRTKTTRHLPFGALQSLPIAEKPWASISMDFIVDLPLSSGFDSIWVVVDRLTKYAHFVPTVKTLTAEQLATLFLDHIFKHHGLPHDIVSDRGSVFTSKFWKRFTSLCKIHSNLSTAFHPQTDGQTERVNAILEQYLRIYSNYQQNDWSDLLPLAQFSYNNAVHTSTNTSPFFANFGYHPTLELNNLTTVLVPSAENRIQLLQQTHQFLKQNIAKANADMALHHDRRILQSPSFKVNDLVWLIHHQVKTSRPCAKLDNKRLGPFKIIQEISKIAFKLELPLSMKIHPVFHISHLEPHIHNDIPNRIQPPPPPIIVNQEQEWEVEEILDSKKFHRTIKYLIKWKGYSTADNSWEPINNLSSCKNMVDNFHLKNPSKPRLK